MVAFPVGAVDALAVNVTDARAEAHADHGEGGEVYLGIAVRVGVVLFQIKVAFVVQHAVENEGGVAVGAFDGSAVKRRVVVSDEGIELQGEVIEAGAVGLLQHAVRHGKALSHRWPTSCLLPSGWQHPGCEMPSTTAARAAR